MTEPQTGLLGGKPAGGDGDTERKNKPRPAKKWRCVTDCINAGRYCYAGDTVSVEPKKCRMEFFKEA